MFVKSAKFLKAHGGRRSDLSIYGQEMNNATWSLPIMSHAIRSTDANLDQGATFDAESHRCFPLTAADLVA